MDDIRSNYKGLINMHSFWWAACTVGCGIVASSEAIPNSIRGFAAALLIGTALYFMIGKWRKVKA